jgi:hypothetical protein
VPPNELQAIDGCEGPTLASPKARGVFGNKDVKKWGDPYVWANVQHQGMLYFIDSHYHYLEDKVEFYIYVITSNNPSYDTFEQYRIPETGSIPFGLRGNQMNYAISRDNVQPTYGYKVTYAGNVRNQTLVWSKSLGYEYDY